VEANTDILRDLHLDITLATHLGMPTRIPHAARSRRDTIPAGTMRLLPM
jgi:hypothetical protein